MNTQLNFAQQAVRQVLQLWQQAACKKDVHGVMRHYAADLVSFDAILQLRFRGREAYRQHWETCMTYCPGDMIFEMQDLQIETSGNLAFCHYLSRCGAVGKNGEEHTAWMRGTTCLRQIDGEWRIVHEHFSMPFDPVTNQLLNHLKP